MTTDEARSLIQQSLGPPGDGPEPDLSEPWGVLAADGLWRRISNTPPTEWRDALEDVTLTMARRCGAREAKNLAVATGYVCDGCGAASVGLVPSYWICRDCRADVDEARANARQLYGSVDTGGNIENDAAREAVTRGNRPARQLRAEPRSKP